MFSQAWKENQHAAMEQRIESFPLLTIQLCLGAVKELLSKMTIINLDLMSCTSNKPKIPTNFVLSFKKGNYIKMELFAKKEVLES